MRKHRLTIQFCLAFLLLTCLAVPGFAQTGFGVRAGISAQPNQFYLGAHVTTGEVVKNFWFKPNMEVGFGNHVTQVALNGEFVYQLNIAKSEWVPYLGGGPAINIATFHGEGNTGNVTDTGPGFNFLGGVGKTKGVFAEIKVGLIDSPEFKFGIGYTFR